MRTSLLSLLAGIACIAPLRAPAWSARETADHLLHSPRLLGDPGGVRSQLEELGITLQLFYNQFLAWKPAGTGADSDEALGHDASYDLIGWVDFDELAGWPGLDFLLHLKGQYDRSINDHVGALSDPIDDADFDEPIYVDQLWVQQAVFGDRVRLLAGFLETQTVFDRNEFANSEDFQFLSTFLDNNAVVPLPNGLATVLIVSPLEGVELAAGAADADNAPRQAGFDTAFDGLASLTGYLEVTLRTDRVEALRQLPGALRLGVFRDGRRLGVFSSQDPVTGLPDTDRGHLGFYLSFDQMVYRESRTGREGLGVFARFGRADEDVNLVEWFWSTGLQYVGAVPGRDADVLGVGVYQAIGSDRYRESVDPDFHRETGVELYYRIAALPWLAVTPDLQYIADPGATDSTDDAFVGTIRFRVAF